MADDYSMDLPHFVYPFISSQHLFFPLYTKIPHATRSTPIHGFLNILSKLRVELALSDKDYLLKASANTTINVRHWHILYNNVLA